MLSFRSIGGGLGGAWQLFLGRPQGLEALDRSVDGFWRSFAVVLLLVPINAVTLLAAARIEGATVSVKTVLVDALPLLLADWVIFPITLALAAGWLEVKRTYVSYVVARNWAAPIAATIVAVPVVVQGAGWLGAEAAAWASLLAVTIVLRYHYLVLRIALRTSVPVSIALVVIDLVLSLLLVAVFA